MTDFRALLADDAFAASFQSLGQYRTALLAILSQPESQGPTDEKLEATARAAELLSMKKQGGLTSPTPDGIHAQLQEQRLAGLRAVAALAQPAPQGPTGRPAIESELGETVLPPDGFVEVDHD